MNLATKVLNKPIGSYVATLPFIDIKNTFILSMRPKTMKI